MKVIVNELDMDNLRKEDAIKKQESKDRLDVIGSRISELIEAQMYDFEEAYLIADGEMDISHFEYLKLKEVYA